MKKKLILIFLGFASAFSSIAATRTTTQSGNYSDPNTWDCTCIPSSTDIVRLEDGDTLTIDSSVTVAEFRYRFGENSADASRLVVDSTLTITGDFRFEAPFFSNATADVLINSSGNIDVGDQMRLLLSNNENGLTYNITVDGTLDIANEFQHGSGLLSSSNVVNLDVDGTFSCGAMSYTFSASNSEININASGGFTTQNISVDLNESSSNFSFTGNSGADISTRFVTVTALKSNSNIELLMNSGTQWEESGPSTLTLDARSTNSNVRLDISDTLKFSNSNILCREENDSLVFTIRNGGRYQMSQYARVRNIGSNPSYVSLEILTGGSMRTGGAGFLDIESSNEGTLNLDIFGNYNSGSIDMDLRNASIATLDFGAGCSVALSDFDLTSQGDCDIVITNASTAAVLSLGDFDLRADENDSIVANLGLGYTIGGRYFQSTNGDNSYVRTNLNGGTIDATSLRMDVLTTAATADNVFAMTSSGGAVLEVNNISMDNGVRDATILSTENGSNTIRFDGSTTTDLPIRNTIDYDNLIISNSSSAGVTVTEGSLDTTNFHGDLTITTGGKLDITPTSGIQVQGLVSNSGIFNEESGNGLIVGSNYIAYSGSEFYHHGGNVEIGGSFTNSGLFDGHTTNGEAFKTGGLFSNAGTVECSFDTLDIGGNLVNSGTLQSQGTDIYLTGDWNNTGSYFYQTGDSVVLDGTANQGIAGNAAFYNLVLDNANGAAISSGHDSIVNKLTLVQGQLNTNGNLTFLSTNSNTAMLTDLSAGTGSITGNVTVQRYLDKGNGWYMLGAPVTGATLADWNTELPMSGFTGSDEPTNPWVSVYTYDETTRPVNPPAYNIGTEDSGYVAATNITNGLTPGEGWFVYFQSVKNGVTPKTMDVTGPLRTNTVNLSLDFSLLYTPNVPDNGWNLIANPYASPVNWNLVTKPTQIQNAGVAYRRNSTGNYVAVDPASNDILSSSEGVWVQVAPTTNPFVNPGIGNSQSYTLTFNENDKVESTDNYNNRLSNPNQEIEKLFLRLKYSGSSSYEDVSEIRVNESSSVYYDQHFDARKLAHSLGTFPNISSTTALDTTNESLMWNSIPNNDSLIIPVKIWQKYPANQNRSFTVEFDGIDEWVKNNKCLIMEDRLNNVMKRLDANDQDYTFQARDTISIPYIFLNYYTPLEVESDDITCFGYNDGTASVKGLGSGTHDYIWVDANNNIVMSEKDKSGPSTMNTLAPGEYVVYVSDNGACGEVAATIEISEPDPIIADFTSDVDSVWMNLNSTIYFSNSSINADEYHWDFGDGNTSDLESPAHTYTGGGIYTVKLVAITGVCSDTLTKVVTVINNVGIEDQVAFNRDPINIYQYNNETFVELNFTEATDVVINMFDVIGRNTIDPLQLKNVTSRTVKLDVPNNLIGVYTISVIANEEKEAKKIYYTRR